MRAISVSMSPSLRSRRATWPATQSVGSRPSGAVRWRKIWPSSRVWASLIILRKSGIWQTSQSSRTVAGPPMRRRISGSLPSWARACWSSASRARQQDRVGRAALQARQQARRRNGNRARCCATSGPAMASKRWFSIASTISGASAPISAVVPKLPSFICRPARPAIWASSAGGQAARAAAVELGEPGEGDMDQVHVEPHADGVGRHQMIDLAGLVHLDLGIAGAGAERAHDHGAAAPLAAHHLGDAIDLGGREGDHGAARRQAGGLLRAGVAQAWRSAAG